MEKRENIFNFNKINKAVASGYIPPLQLRDINELINRLINYFTNKYNDNLISKIVSENPDKEIDEYVSLLQKAITTTDLSSLLNELFDGEERNRFEAFLKGYYRYQFGMNLIDFLNNNFKKENQRDNFIVLPIIYCKEKYTILINRTSGVIAYDDSSLKLLSVLPHPDKGSETKASSLSINISSLLEILSNKAIKNTNFESVIATINIHENDIALINYIINKVYNNLFHQDDSAEIVKDIRLRLFESEIEKLVPNASIVKQKNKQYSI